MSSLMSKEILNVVRLVEFPSEGNEKGERAPSAPVRYGLPCVKCRLYYSAELSTCPICGCSDRVSPAA
jgi:hypothetical protein